jgi:hypothetical protein
VVGISPKPAEILKEVRIWPNSSNANWRNGAPEEFNVWGYNPESDEWELVAYLQGPNTFAVANEFQY